MLGNRFRLESVGPGILAKSIQRRRGQFDEPRPVCVLQFPIRDGNHDSQSQSPDRIETDHHGRSDFLNLRPDGRIEIDVPNLTAFRCWSYRHEGLSRQKLRKQLVFCPFGNPPRPILPQPPKSRRVPSEKVFLVPWRSTFLVAIASSSLTSHRSIGQLTNLFACYLISSNKSAALSVFVIDAVDASTYHLVRFAFSGVLDRNLLGCDGQATFTTV